MRTCRKHGWKNRGWKKQMAAAAIGAAALTGAAGLASARPPGGGHCGGGGGGPFALERVERDLAGLDLPKEQLDAVYAVIDRARTQRRSYDAPMSQARERMRELLEQDAPSQEAVDAQAEAIGALTTEMRKVELRALVEVRNLVGAEPWKKLEQQQPRFGRARGGRGDAPDAGPTGGSEAGL